MSFDESKTLKLKICLESENCSTIIFEHAKKKKIEKFTRNYSAKVEDSGDGED